MASTRESSPVSEAGSTSVPLLSPTSKVKALLANFSDDSDASDKESVSGNARARLIKSMQKPTSTRSSSFGAQAILDQKDASNATESSEDEDVEVTMPRGRLAAAMRALARSTSPETQSTTPSSRRLAKRPTPVRSPSSPQSAESDAASEDSEAPLNPRKRKVRTARNPTPSPTSAEQPPSPGLFVSPAKSVQDAANVSDADDLVEDTADSRFKALLERKRKEAQAKEDVAEALRVKRAEERKRLQASIEADDMDISDDEGGRRLTQQAKPTRKASKKALEEMHRESQRLSRNQQLAHYATTKKKFSTKDFLKRFNPQADVLSKEATPELPRQEVQEPSSSSPARRSEGERGDTPPTSPPSMPDDLTKTRGASPIAPATTADSKMTIDEEDILQTSLNQPTEVNKGKGKAGATPPQSASKIGPSISKKRQIRVRPVKREIQQSLSIDGSDSDLEIVETKHDRLKIKLEAMFNQAPIKKSAEDQSLYALQMLAHLKSPGRQQKQRNEKPSLTTSELQMSLQQKARQQAAREREEKLEDLRKRGIIVQSTEERQKEMAEVEDLIAKARREVEELAKKEKADAKRERKENGEVDPLGDSSEDEDWEDNQKEVPGEHSASASEEDEEDLSGSASGSDEEEDENEMDVDQEDGEDITNSLVDNEASETEDDDAEDQVNLSLGEDFINDGDLEEEDEDALPTLPQNRRARNTNVISDDEDESHQDMHTPSVSRKIVSPQTTAASPDAPTSVLRSATKTFIPGVTANGPVGLGLTQIFAGTMDDSQASQSQSAQQPFETPVRNNHAMAFLRGNNAPSLPPFVPTMSEEETQAFTDGQIQQDTVTASQRVGEESQAIHLNFTQSQINGFDSLIDNSQASPFPDTQDVGFIDRTPIKGRFVDAPASTVDTMILDDAAIPGTIEASPVVKRKGKLRRRAPQVFSDDEDVAVPLDIEDDLEINENVFDVMRKAAKKKVVVDEFDKKNSKAKEMVEEQANESEDEYAGLGGASDDDSDEEADEYVKAMIDDESGQNIDKAKIAAFFADRERAKDEKEIEKLYKDITSGMMRRKRGADYDLSDSDDGGEARSRMKRKEFAKMRKALLADERIGKIAENPKRQAFLRAIEDRGSEDEMDFLNDFPEQEDSQSQSQADSQQVIPNSQPGDMGPPKRKRTDDSQEEERLPPHLRRTKPAKKPSNLSEIRESLSSLIEEQNSFAVPADTGSDSEDDLEIEMEGEGDLAAPSQKKDKENRDPFALRRTKASIIDRISLKRESSSNVSNSARMAFAVSSSAPGFKVPALLRKATTNSSITSNASTGAAMSSTERMAGGAASDGVKRGGGKNSGVNYFARETERRAAVAKTEARREKKRFKGAEGRRKVVGGLLGSGTFE